MIEENTLQIPTPKTQVSVVSADTEQLIRASLSENTLKAYQRALDAFDLWVSLGKRPFTDMTLAAYLTHLHNAGKSPSTISQVLASVKWRLKHQKQNVHLPITEATLAGIRREGKDRGRGQVDGLTWQDVDRVCINAESEGTITGLRDSAMIRLMSDCMLRISEVVAVNVDDLRGKTLTLRSSKTDQDGKGEVLYITEATRKVLKCYRQQAEIIQGAVFRRIRKGGHLQKERLTADSARLIIKTRARDSGIDGFISGHSLRVGTAVSLAQAGASIVDMMVAGRWKSSQMPAHYAKAELTERGAIARFKEQA